MTKPSYEELERLAKAATPGPWGWYRSDPNWLGAWCLETQSFSPTLNVEAVEASDEDRAFIAAANPQTILDLLAELARVRGLLQRQSEVLQRVASWDFDFYGDCVAEAKKLASDALSQQNDSSSSSTIGADTLPCPNCGKPLYDSGDHGIIHVHQADQCSPSGAESADIGKLDAADKKCAYCKHTHTFQFDEIVDDDCPVVGCPCMHFLAGSAETGGEKAAPQEYEGMLPDLRPRYGWMDSVDFDHELGNALGGNVVYPTKENLYENRKCLDTDGECTGIRVVIFSLETPHLYWQGNAETHLGCGHSKWDSRRDCIACLQFAVDSLNHQLANFPRSSQNHTVSSGVEGAHEGTTADKYGAREPEKLNNAPNPLDYFLVTYGFDGNNHARQMLISCWAAARQYERKQAPASSLSQEEDLLKQGFEGLRDAAIRLRDESSLSSPPPELNMTRADDGRPQFLWFGGKYYTIEHPECMDALLKAIREFPTTPPTPTGSGPESRHSGKQNTADKSELLPTQLPKEK